MFGFITRNMLTGLITILPVVLTAYLLYWLAVSAESFLGELIRLILAEELYWPGMGVIAGLLVLFVIGLLMHGYLFRRLFAKMENFILHLPVIKPVYRMIRDFFDYFKPNKEQEFDQVVAIEMADTGMKVIGFVTETVSNKLPKGYDDDDSVLVYLPLSYMIGGYTVLVPRKSVTVVDMSMEEAMRFTLTAGVTSKGDGVEK
ncbi:MAG: DUF502 domain-containing protein [Pseudomonadota bacterium]|nr:DUF502 domain-containing protein [Pseudomonadota bacterium]